MTDPHVASARLNALKVRRGDTDVALSHETPRVDRGWLAELTAEAEPHYSLAILTQSHVDESRQLFRAHCKACGWLTTETTDKAACEVVASEHRAGMRKQGAA